MILFISEEYGYREWIANLTDDEWTDLVRRWKTIKGISCLVPVPFIIPQAKLIEWEKHGDPKFGQEFLKQRERADKFAHIHEWDDSHLDDIDYEIPETPDESFHLDGNVYSREEVLKLHNQTQIKK